MNYLSRAEVDLFDQQLAKIPDLLTELAESITGRAGYGSGRRTPPKSRPPVNLDAQDLYDRCNAVLVAIAHDISEQRGIPIEMGVTVQVLKRGTMFAQRGQRLTDFYRKYPSFDAAPADEVASLEKTVLRRSIPEIWAETKEFFATRDPREVVRAEADPHYLMALVFRWYLFSGAQWAGAADVVRWLHTHRFALQLIESGNEALTDACWIVTTIERALGIAGHAPLGHTERGQAEDARVTLSTIEAVAGAAGEYGLTRNRLRKLIERKHVRPLTTAVDGTKLYRFGDVLAAHRDTRTETR